MTIDVTKEELKKLWVLVMTEITSDESKDKELAMKLTKAMKEIR